jgi:hypothetical protein
MAYKGSIVKEDLSKLVDFMDDGSRKKPGKKENKREIL